MTYHPAEPFDQSRQSLLARLDSQDTVFVEPLREFLFSSGCTVIVNPTNSVTVHYQIVYGDSAFVKSILDSTNKTSNRVLVISWDDLAKTNPNLGVPHVKQVLFDGNRLSTSAVEEIFKFFFISSNDRLDLRTHPPVDRFDKEPQIHEEEIVIKEDSVRKQDKERIDSLIADIFAPESKEEKGKRGTHVFRKIIGILILLPIFWYSSTIATSLLSYKLSTTLIERGDSRGAAKVAGVGVVAARAGRVLVTTAALPFFGSAPTFIAGQEKFFLLLKDTGEILAKASLITGNARTLGTQLLSQQTATQETHPAVITDRLRTDVGALTQDLGLLGATWDELVRTNTFPVSLLKFGNMDAGIRARIGQIRDMLSTADHLLLVYKEAAGFKRTQTYLVLFQNSMEIRPTGGFIGSVGLVTMTDGNLVDFTIYDSYELDGQLRGHVDPPLPIRTILGQEHWYLRDSNWDPDFSVSGERAAWFYEKETGQKVDGVIGLTTSLIVSLLRATGPITLTDYNDRITADNFLGKALFYTKSDFFPGSTQKKDFLGSLSRAILERLTTESTLNTTALLTATLTGVARRDIQLFVADETLERLVKQYGWAGSLDPVSCGPTCEALPIAVVDANLGVNKANFFLTQELFRDIEIQENHVSEVVTFVQHNSSSGETGQEDGNYKSYTRIYLPAGARVDHVLLNGQVLPVGNQVETTQELPYWEEGIEPGRTVIGIAATLLPKAERQIRIIYNKDIVMGQGSKLALVTRAQPGSPATTLTVSVASPPSLLMDGVLPLVAVGRAGRSRFVARTTQLEYNSILSEDSKGLVTFITN